MRRGVAGASEASDSQPTLLKKSADPESVAQVANDADKEPQSRSRVSDLASFDSLLVRQLL